MILMNNSNRFSAKQFFKTKISKPSQPKIKIKKQKKVHVQAKVIDDRLEIVASSLNIGSKQSTLQIQQMKIRLMKKQQSNEKDAENSQTSKKQQNQRQPVSQQIYQKESLKTIETEAKTADKPNTSGKYRAKIFKEELIDKIPLQNKTSLHRWKYGEGATPTKLIIGNWNVNGIRSILSKKMLYPYINFNKPDIICISQTKADEKNFDSSPISLNGYHSYWNFPKHSSGYSGVAIFSKFLPKSATQDMLEREHSQEGRILTLEFQAFMLINIYVPTVGKDLERSDYRKRYDTAFREHVNRVRTAHPAKPVIIVGDLNVAHNELDTHPGKQIMLTPSFTTIERQGFQELLNMGYTDVYRALHPGVRAYTWWYVNIGGRDRLDTPGLGRRIDYFLMPTDYMRWVKRCDILREFLGADHCPVEMEIDMQL